LKFDFREGKESSRKLLIQQIQALRVGAEEVTISVGEIEKNTIQTIDFSGNYNIISL